MKIHTPKTDTSLYIPLYAAKVQAGSPTFSDDYVEGQLDLNDHVIQNAAATFFVRVTGDSMVGAGIHPEDILVVDRSVTPVHGKIVIAAFDGELTVKRLYSRGGVVRLEAENDAYEPISMSSESDLVIWGVVTYVIHATT